MSKIFNSVKLRKPQTNVFDLSHEKKLSCNMGDLIPIYVQDVVPGDKFRVSSENLVRLAPMIAPMMHRVNIYTHFFFVPNRLVWNEFEKFITGGEAGTDTPTFPRLNIDSTNKEYLAKGSLGDYLGLPTWKDENVTNNLLVSAIPFRGYQLIYNEYYRDQNVQPKIDFHITGENTVADDLAITTLRKRCWEKDYFTSALPWTQRGGEVNLPNLPVYTELTEFMKSDGTTHPADGTVNIVGGNMKMTSGADTAAPLQVQNIDGIDISINDLRRATRLQQWLERNALGGSRYIEQIFAHFGVRSSDKRLQRPEYLGGGKQPIVVSEVLNTSATATEAQGSMSGHGISIGNSNQFSKYFEEHGYIFGIMSILPRTAYQQGYEKHWKKFDKLDWYFPEFANLGEQAVTDGELYHDWDAAPNSDDLTFGYQSRYSEYKFKPSTVHGDFKDNMSYWHMGRIFSGKPSLNSAFVSSDPTLRVFAVTDPNVHHLYVQIYNNVRAIRPMPVFGTPML